MIRVLLVLLALFIVARAVRAEAIDALDEVNRARAARGLKPYLRDPALTAGAINAAEFRAARLIKGHTANDFRALPPGVGADAAGCAGNSPTWGFMACAMFENYTYAGAAKVMGRDGNLYCHLFVRGRSSSIERVPHGPQPLVSARAGPVRRRR